MSQGSYNVPTGGSESAITFAGQCNTAWNATASKNSGGSAPANGPSSAALQFQDWFDTTTAAYPILKVYDSASWVRVGTLDVSGHNWFPQMGGGSTTLASSATVDIGASPQTYLSISGTAAITSLGSSAQIGEEKNLHFTSSATLTNSASIICPGAASIVSLPGDICRAIYIGAGAWIIANYMRALPSAGAGLQTGDVVWNYGAGFRSGFARCNGLTVGDGSSNATEYASGAALNLFTLLWTNGVSDTESLIYTSAGGLTTKGATAAADWAAHKAITTPDLRGRSPFGLDGMGNSAASRVTGTTASPNGTTTGAVGGAQTVTLSTANLAAYTPAGTMVFSSTGNANYTPAGSVTIGNQSQFSSQSLNATAGVNAYILGGGSLGFTGSFSGTAVSLTFSGTAQGGSATAVNKMPPFKLGTYYMAL